MKDVTQEWLVVTGQPIRCDEQLKGGVRDQCTYGGWGECRFGEKGDPPFKYSLKVLYGGHDTTTRLIRPRKQALAVR